MYQVVKRDGTIAEFNISKISAAITSAFEALNKQYHPSVIDLISLHVTSDFESKIKDDLGADSLDVLQLLMALEEEKGIVIPDDVLPTLVTVGDIVAYMESQQ